MIHIVLGLMLVQAPQIGSSLSDTVQLVYESGGITQAPWTYESVRVTGGGEYDRCVAVARRAQPERETCVRGDTLFERNAVGTRVPVRPVGRNMRLVVATPAGSLMEYTTGDFATRSVAGATNISVIATTIVTRDSAGTLIRRLREDYAPAMLTAVWGIFEVPDGTGGWRTEREFSLNEVQYVRSGIEIPAPYRRARTAGQFQSYTIRLVDGMNIRAELFGQRALIEAPGAHPTGLEVLVLQWSGAVPQVGRGTRGSSGPHRLQRLPLPSELRNGLHPVN